MVLGCQCQQEEHLSMSSHCSATEEDRKVDKRVEEIKSGPAAVT